MNFDSTVFAISDQGMTKVEAIRFNDEESLGLVLDRLVGSILSMRIDSDPENTVTSKNPNYLRLYKLYFSNKRE